MMDEIESLSRRQQASETRLTRVETLLEVLPTMQQQLSALTASATEQHGLLREMGADIRGLRRDMDLTVNKGEFAQMSARVADNTESINEMRKQMIEIRTTDFRWLVGLQIASTVGLAGLLFKVLGWL